MAVISNRYWIVERLSPEPAKGALTNLLTYKELWANGRCNAEKRLYKLLCTADGNKVQLAGL